jgi:hypothetical protein
MADTDDSVKVRVPAKECKALIEQLRRDGRVRWIDAGGRECYLVLDRDRYPRREDLPKQYVHLVAETLADLAIVMSIFEENGRGGAIPWPTPL